VSTEPADREGMFTDKAHADTSDLPRHHPTFYVARGECWVACICDWRWSGGNQMAAQLEFGKHLVETTHQALLPEAR